MFSERISDREFKKNVRSFVEDPGCSPRHTTETIAMSGACGSFVFLLLTFMLTRLQHLNVLEKVLTQMEATIMEGIAIVGVIYSVIFGVYFYATYGNGSKTAAVRVYMYANVEKLFIIIPIVYLVLETDVEYAFNTTAELIQILLLWMSLVLVGIAASVYYIKRKIKKGQLPIETDVVDIVIVIGIVLMLLDYIIDSNAYFFTMLTFSAVCSTTWTATYSFCVYKMKLSYAKKYDLEKYLPQMKKI